MLLTIDLKYVLIFTSGQSRSQLLFIPEFLKCSSLLLGHFLFLLLLLRNLLAKVKLI